jgi:two-component system, LytTR family, sensor histidine kinase AlgZ
VAGAVRSVLLCKARPLLARLPANAAGLGAWALPVAVAFGGSWLVHGIASDARTRPAARRQQRACASALSIAAIAGMLAAVLLRYLHLRRRWQAQVAAQAQAEVEALQARIRPHFLFNSMNRSPAWCAATRPPPSAPSRTSRRTVPRRAGQGGRLATLAEEIDLCERYLGIERCGWATATAVDWQIDADVPRDQRLPRLLLQPLVENAVLHGIARLAEGGRIDIAIRATATRCC